MICAPAESGDVRRRQVDHEQPSISVDRDVSLAPDNLLGRVIAAFPGARRLH
jgi:hypothetical protein